MGGDESDEFDCANILCLDPVVAVLSLFSRRLTVAGQYNWPNVVLADRGSGLDWRALIVQGAIDKHGLGQRDDPDLLIDAHRKSPWHPACGLVINAWNSQEYAVFLAADPDREFRARS